MSKEVIVPDLGNTQAVDVIEILVKVGDKVEAETPLLSLESDKATMEVPSPSSGIVERILVKVGDKVSSGTPVLVLKSPDVSVEPILTSSSVQVEAGSHHKSSSVAQSEPPATMKGPLALYVPDIGTPQAVDVIEVYIKPGDTLAINQPLLMLEGEKASIELPSTVEGTVLTLAVKVGDKINQGSLILQYEPTGHQDVVSKLVSPTIPSPGSPIEPKAVIPTVSALPSKDETHSSVFAGPAVRRFARVLGVNLNEVKGSGRKGRIQQEDIEAYVKQRLAQPQSAISTGQQSLNGLNFPPLAKQDFSTFGPIDIQPLSKIKKLSGAFLQRNAVLVPHVTQFDEADITELEAFRQQSNQQSSKTGTKITPLVFIMKAVVAALKRFPSFNASLDNEEGALILKKYYHLGVAVDTPNGLVVPVIRNVDQKGILALSQELAQISEKARTKGLAPADMQGGTFTISSLGGIGGTAFTPIVNLPEVAILGVSRSSMKPVYQGDGFIPRLMLPLSLSYDHRVIDGAEGARFARYLAELLGDIRQLLL